MNIEQFRQIKERMLFIYDALENGRVENQEELAEEFFSLQDQLLQNDLSSIPFEEWEGMIIGVEEGELDFSNTRANLDFSLLEEVFYDTLNVKGCNVRGVEHLDEYKEEYFDSEFVESHPEYFPDKDLPPEIREKFYNRRIEFSDLRAYPALIKSVHASCFNKHSASSELIKKIGVDNAIRMLNENPEFVRIILEEDKPLSAGDWLLTLDDSNQELTYEDAKEKIYLGIKEALKTGKFRLGSIETLPDEFKKDHPDMFLDESVEADLSSSYYLGNLTVREIRVYQEELKGKDLDIGIRSNYDTQAIIKLFGSLENYFEKVPVQLDPIVPIYAFNLVYNRKGDSINIDQLDSFLGDAIRNKIKNSGDIVSLDEAELYRKYVSLEDIYGDTPTFYQFIQNCGFDNLLQYNKENYDIFGDTRAEVLKLFAISASDIPSVTVNNPQELRKYLRDIIFSIRMDEEESISPAIQKKIDGAFPEFFITQQDINYALSIADSKDYSGIEWLLKSALNGNFEKLAYLLNKYKTLLPMLENKEIMFERNKEDSWNWKNILKPIYENKGKTGLLDVLSKYGTSFMTVMNQADTSDFSTMIEKIANSTDYEPIINEYIYNCILSKNILDIRTLPESFKTQYPELYLPKDAPQELCDLFYGKFDGIGTIFLTAKDIYIHPEWHQYLMNVDLAKNLKIKSVNIYDGSRVKEASNLYSVLAQYMSRQEVNTFIMEYGNYIDGCWFRFQTHYKDVIDFKQSLYQNIYDNIIQRRITNYESLPKEFQGMFPNIFLTEPTNPELREYFLKVKDDFYNRRINGDYIRNNPQCVQFLKNINLEVIFQYMPVLVNSYYWETNYVNAVSLIEKQFGQEKAFEILTEYDKYLNEAAKYNILSQNKFYKDLSVENLDRCVYDVILQRGMPYFENMPQSFKDKNPDMFLPKDAPQELKDKFYNRELTFSDLSRLSGFMENFKKTNIVWGFAGDFKWAIEMYNNEEMESANYKRLKIISEFQKIEDKHLQDMFKTFILSEESNIEIGKLEVVAEMLQRLSKSNSLEMYTFKEELASQLIKIDNPIEGLDKIESVFIKNHLPVVGKAYSVFNILHPGFSGFNFADGSRISPVLKGKSPRTREIIVFSDLVRASLGSNNRSMRDYLHTLEKGNEIYERLKTNPNLHSELSPKDKEIFIAFSNNLMTMYNNTYKGKLDNCVEFSTDPVEQINQLKKLLSPDGSQDYNLPDRAVSMFCHFAGFDTVDQLKDYMQTKIQQAETRNIEASNQPMKLEVGDFIKGIGDIRYLSKILQNGSVAREFLGGSSAGSDYTPLDTDLSRVLDASGEISDILHKSLSNSYGPIWFVLKNDDRFTITRESALSEEETKVDPHKLEAFATNSDGHYGIRSGFSSSDINYIMVENKDEKIEMTIATNGFYIPIVNTNGEIIFTHDEYQQLRSKMDGLTYYGIDTYNLSQDLVTEATSQLASQIPESQAVTAYKREIINKHVREALESISQSFDQEFSLKSHSDGDLSEGIVELIDTGSTGRGTNKPGEGDFDFMMKIDKSILENPEKLSEFKTALLKSFGRTPEELKEGELTGNGDFRLKEVALDDVVVDIDISFAQKTDAVQYSTDEALFDRLSTIKEQYPEQYDYVVANILLAKQVLKEAEAYKPSRGAVPQGGLGGVGIENWVLQHGGSFEDAAKSFLTAATGKTFQEFTEVYKVWDFGENHMAADKNAGPGAYRFPHDNFVTNNMNEEGFEKMKNALYSYFDNKNQGQATIVPPEDNIGPQQL